MDLEIIDYDLEGAAYKNGVVVDGAVLLVKARRNPVTVPVDPKDPEGEHKLVSPPGEVMALRLPVASLKPAERKRLFAAFTEHELVVKILIEAHYDSEVQDAKALDEKIAAAARATAVTELATKEHARVVAETERATKEHAALEAAIEAKRNELAELTLKNHHE